MYYRRLLLIVLYSIIIFSSCQKENDSISYAIKNNTNIELTCFLYSKYGNSQGIIPVNGFYEIFYRDGSYDSDPAKSIRSELDSIQIYLISDSTKIVFHISNVTNYLDNLFQDSVEWHFRKFSMKTHTNFTTENTSFTQYYYTIYEDSIVKM